MIPRRWNQKSLLLLFSGGQGQEPPPEAAGHGGGMPPGPPVNRRYWVAYGTIATSGNGAASHQHQRTYRAQVNAAFLTQTPSSRSGHTVRRHAATVLTGISLVSQSGRHLQRAQRLHAATIPLRTALTAVSAAAPVIGARAVQAHISRHSFSAGSVQTRQLAVAGRTVAAKGQFVASQLRGAGEWTVLTPWQDEELVALVLAAEDAWA